MPAGPRMPEFKTEWTTGNLTSIITTIIAIGALIYHFSGEQAERRAKDDEFERTITRLVVERDARRKLVDDRFEMLMRDRDRTARIEATLDLVSKSLQRVENKLDRVESPRN